MGSDRSIWYPSLSLSPSNQWLNAIHFVSLVPALSFYFSPPFLKKKTAVNGCVCVSVNICIRGSLYVGQAQKETEEAGQAPAMEPDITIANMGINK